MLEHWIQEGLWHLTMKGKPWFIHVEIQSLYNLYNQARETNQKSGNRTKERHGSGRQDTNQPPMDRIRVVSQGEMWIIGTGGE